MAGKSSKFGNRGASIFGLDTSGKRVSYHTLQGADATPGVSPQGIEASGGIIQDYASGPAIYRAHIFTGSGTFSVSNIDNSAYGDNIEYLVVGGGGSGGSNLGGGGGAGGLRTNYPGVQTADATPLTAPAYPVSVGSYTVVVGAGGARVFTEHPGTQGGDSEFYPTPVSYPSPTRVRSVGGGKGASGVGGYPAATRAGGSGGGAPGYGNNPTGGPGNTPDPSHPKRQGYNGGQNGPGSGPNYIGGGGGGAGADGYTGDKPGGTGANTPTSGNGGVGVRVDIIPSPPSINSATCSRVL